jgi:N-glycosylase/DNA lyase
MFDKKEEIIDSRCAIVVRGLGNYSLRDTFECGQCFRYEVREEKDGYVEYVTVVKNHLINVAERERGELIFYGCTDELFREVIVPYFALEVDYEKIKEDIISHTDSEWLKKAAESASGIRILSQDPWETLFSFIISQNNNIPRIRGIIKRISSAYGVNITLQNGGKSCPLKKTDAAPCEEICKNCGCCYTFPSSRDITENPELLLSAKVGFRYKYLCDAAEKVESKVISLKEIENANSYEYTVETLSKILGVGPKVAACVALFGFGNLEAFPIDVWMKRAIDTYFDGKLDHTAFGKYAGIAQQYIFHYIRNIEKEEKA